MLISGNKNRKDYLFLQQLMCYELRKFVDMCFQIDACLSALLNVHYSNWVDISAFRTIYLDVLVPE